jgi:hypothetical protein
VKAPLRYASFLAGAWLATLGACGRTLPEADDTFAYAGAGDDTGNGGTGNRTAAGGGHTGGGSNSGGTGARGSGGTRTGGGTGAVDTGGSGGDGPSFGGGGGDIAPFGGTGDRGTGGTFERGGSGNGGTGGPAVGGRFAGGEGGGSGMGAAAGLQNTAGAPNMFPNIICDESTCDPATSVCCKRRGAPSTCEPIENGCSTGATLTCSGSGQCGPNEVCCFHFNASRCTDSCDASVGSRGDPPTAILCDSNADCAPDEICALAPRGLAYCATTVP